MASRIAEENIGMAMVYTIGEELREYLEQVRRVI